MGFSADDARHMARALQLAARGLYTTDPNPRVGCVIVRDGHVIGEGWHMRAGEAHAEVAALRAAGESNTAGATVYVTLEPCCHHGRTPPCSDALIAARVGRVVVATQDPNPHVAGRGIAALREAGIQVDAQLMPQQAAALNPGFIQRMQRQRPWVRVKLAASLDGRTALQNGESHWITGEAARLDVQRWRARSSAVLTGIGTVLADDPSLNVRAIDSGRQPLRVVLDSRLRLPTTARMLSLPGTTLVLTAERDAGRTAALRAAGAEVVAMPAVEGKPALTAAVGLLAERGVNELHVEAGPTLCGALLAAGLVDELVWYVAPHILGDRGRAMFGLAPLTDMADRVAVRIEDVRAVGGDWRFVAKIGDLL